MLTAKLSSQAEPALSPEQLEELVTNELLAQAGGGGSEGFDRRRRRRQRMHSKLGIHPTKVIEATSQQYGMLQLPHMLQARKSPGRELPEVLGGCGGVRAPAETRRVSPGLQKQWTASIASSGTHPALRSRSPLQTSCSEVQEMDCSARLFYLMNRQGPGDQG